MGKISKFVSESEVVKNELLMPLGATTRACFDRIYKINRMILLDRSIRAVQHPPLLRKG